MEVPLDRDTIGDAVLHARQGCLDKRHAAGIVCGGDAVFGHDQVTLKVGGHLADDVFQRLRIKLVVHLGQLGTLRGGQLPLRTVQRAGVVLHAEEVILLNIRKIVGELFLPRSGGKCFTARLGLQVMQREGQTDLDLGADCLDGLPRGSVGAHHQQIAFGCALADENFRLRRAKHSSVFSGGKFDWMAHAEKFPGLCTPDDSYHGITYAERFGKEGAFITKATAQLMRDFGSMQSPMNAYMLNLGLESLHVRMQRHCANGMAVAQFLENHPKVAYVNYCGLESSPYHALAQKYLPNGSCGVVSFGLAGGRQAASTFMKELKLAAIETHVADARTCCLNPASSTHRQMNDEQLAAAGVPAELVRMSCGLESAEDLIADIAQALDKV